MKAETAWRPILEGNLAQRAEETLAAIAEELPRALSGSEPEHANSSILIDDPGLAIFHAYLARTRPGSEHERLASEHLARASAALADVPLSPGLYGGFTGVAWSLQHLQPPEAEAEDPLEGIDEALLEHLSQSPWSQEYDLINGLAGFGVYAAERLPRPSAGLLLERILDRLEETCERRPESLTWRTDPELLPDWQRELCPNGYYNLGVAHGVPGVIGLLGLICQAGILVKRARPLLEQASLAAGAQAPRLRGRQLRHLALRRSAAGAQPVRLVLRRPRRRCRLAPGRPSRRRARLGTAGRRAGPGGGPPPPRADRRRRCRPLPRGCGPCPPLQPHGPSHRRGAARRGVTLVV